MSKLITQTGGKLCQSVKLHCWQFQTRMPVMKNTIFKNYYHRQISNIIIIVRFQILLSSSNFKYYYHRQIFKYYYHRQISNIIIIVKFQILLSSSYYYDRHIIMIVKFQIQGGLFNCPVRML